MNNINKQNFLAEMSKLLTFMYEEDRQTALTMYGKMFDDAADERALLQFLVSPTRQAVVLARAYNAKERKLQVQAQSKSLLEGEEPEALPEFILAIDQLQQEAAELSGKNREDVLPEQITLFSDVAPNNKEDAAEEKPKVEAETPPADKVEAFMEDFAIKTDEPLIQDAENEATPEKAEEPEEPAVELKAEEAKTELVPKTFLLILYVIAAIPVTLAGVALLLVPTLLFLALAAAAVIGGSVILSAAFSGFAVFADIMVVLGIALVVLALALLLLWTFVWFIGAVIVGFINSIIRLGGKWCYKKEVQAA